MPRYTSQKGGFRGTLGTMAKSATGVCGYVSVCTCVCVYVYVSVCTCVCVCAHVCICMQFIVNKIMYMCEMY